MGPTLLFVLFTVPLVASPGPVNILLAGLGVNHGVWKNLPFVGGLICSAALISLSCLLGFQVILQNKIVHQTVVIAGSCYIGYLAIKLYRLSPSMIENKASAHRFRDGLLVTLLNPKFYVMVTAVFAQFIGESVRSAIWVVLGFLLLLTLAHIGWLVVGTTLQRTMRDVRRLGMLNKLMGASLFIFALYFIAQAF